MFLRSAISMAAAMVMTSSAFAADIYEGDSGSYKDAPAVYNPAFSWTGFYLGGHVGHGWGNHEVSSDGFDQVHVFNYDSDGVFGGAQIGYNWQTGNLVLGIEADAGYLGVKGDDFVDDGFTGEIADTEFGAYGVLAGRLGIAADRALFYVKGGLAVAAIETVAGDLDDDGNRFQCCDTRLDETLYGYAIGSGVEYAFASNWTMKAEYLYMNFRNETAEVNDSASTSNHETDLHTVKFGVNYKFGNEGYEPLK